jgi:hypothetical protein
MAGGWKEHCGLILLQRESRDAIRASRRVGGWRIEGTHIVACGVKVPQVTLIVHL